ncbi:hypothetical protein ACFQO4_20580 [Saliphagus sp. GCM10025334]
MATEPATRHNHSTVSRTTERTRTDALAELVNTVSEQIGFPTIDPMMVDGDWYLDRDDLTLKVWTGRDGEQVTVESDSTLAGWSVWHNKTDGTSERVTDRPLEREAAFSVAERLAADLDKVPVACRTGRASE